MDKSQINQIIEHFGKKVVRQYPVQKGYRNLSYKILLSNSQIVNLHLYRAETGIINRIQRTNDLSDFLAKQGVTCRRTLDKRIILIKAGRVQKYACLYNYLPGKTISWEAYTMEHIKQLGGLMSDMHFVASGYLSKQLPLASDEYTQITNRMKGYFDNVDTDKAITSKLKVRLSPRRLDNYLLLLRLTSNLPLRQSLHMDMVRSNILFSDIKKVELTGVIDFEKAAIGHPAFDIARTLAFLLVDCKYKTENQIRKYFIGSGYNKRGKSDFTNVIMKKGSEKIDLLEALLDMFLTYDFYKFLKHNPYEYLDQNEHYCRTRDQLLARGVLTTVD